MLMKSLRIPKGFRAAALGILLVLSCPPQATAQESEVGGRIDPEADRTLREMGEYLSSAESFRFHAEITYDQVRSTGQKILLGGRVDASLSRPGSLHVHFQGDRRHRHILFSNRTFTYFNVLKNLYAQMSVPAELDDALDDAFEKAGFSVPISDFFYADPYLTLIENARSGRVVGLHPVDGKPCHHLAFTHDTIDWQIWIEEGAKPVPRRMVITYKTELGEPQHTATFVEWEFNPRLSNAYFEFRPPAGSAEIDFLPVR
jgi:hypothetical protein